MLWNISLLNSHTDNYEKQEFTNHLLRKQKTNFVCLVSEFLYRIRFSRQSACKVLGGEVVCVSDPHNDKVRENDIIN